MHHFKKFHQQKDPLKKISEMFDYFCLNIGQ